MEQSMKCPSCGKQLPSGMVFCPWDGHALEPTSPPEPRSDPLLDAQVGEYVIKERIGAGGMGIVYRAVQPLIGKQVAIKVMKAEFAEAEELVKRLLVEARVVNAIQHRGVIDIFGFGQLPDGRSYVVMELLHGVPLDAFIRKRGRVGADETAEILDEMLAALGAAHREGVIHRDLKPGNVFLEESDGSRSVKLLDFGIAKVAQSQTIGSLTMSGHILGTPEYMAPEQIRGERIEPTADLYAVGVIAFQMLTGRRPFIGEQMQVLFAQVEEEPPMPSSLVPDLPVELERIVLQLLAKRAAQRFQSAEAVRRELDAFLSKRGRHSTKDTQPATLSTASRTLVLPTPPSIVGVAVPQQGAVTRTEASTSKRLSRRMGTGAGILALALAGIGFAVFHRGASPPQATGASQRGEVTASPPQVPRSPQPRPEPPKAVASASGSPLVLAPEKEEASNREHASSTENRVSGSTDSPSKSPLGAHIQQNTGGAAGESVKAPGSTPATGEPPVAATRRSVPVAKALAAKPASGPAPTASLALQAQPASAIKPIDQAALEARLDDAMVRLRTMDEQAVASPAMARLMEIRKMADNATTDEQRMKVADMLEEWKRKFLSKR